MLSSVHHVAYVVPDLAGAVKLFEEALGLTVEQRHGESAEWGFEFAVLRLRGSPTRVELIHPTRPDTPMGQFLAQTGGGLHHVAYEGGDLATLAGALRARGIGIAAGPRPAPTGWESLDLDPSTTQGLVTQLSQDRE
jgi:methylmalonyl-CoA/ethylmalonyl-CoA epimerase